MLITQIETFSARPLSATVQALLRSTHLSDAESFDIDLFLAPSRFRRARRLLMAGLLADDALPSTEAGNDN